MAAHPIDERRPQRTPWMAALVLVSAALWIFLQTAPWPDTPDGLIHLQRIRALAEALRQGVFYPRWFPDFAFGYGHPILHYYAPVSYYPPALLHLLGLDLLSATRWALTLSYALSGAATYLALAWAGLALTHNLTVLMAALLMLAALPLAALWPEKPPRPDNYTKRLFSMAARLGLPALVGLLLSAFYILPTLLEAGWVGIGAPGDAAGSTAGYAAHFATWSDLGQFAARYRYPSAAGPTVPLPIYALPLLVWGGVTLVWPGRRRFALALTWVVTLLLIWLTTRSSAPLWETAAPLLDTLEVIR